MPDSNIDSWASRADFCQKAARFASQSGDRNGFSVPPSVRLLVSVRSVEEATLAAGAGADIVDVKEPDRGPLGAADPEVWQAIAARIGTELPLSAALGEAIDLLQGERLDSQIAAIPRSFAFAKVGPAGTRDLETVERLWCRAANALPETTAFVAVAYADWQTAGSPPPEDLLSLAARLGIRYWLLDTFAKRGRSVIDVLGAARLAAIGRQTRTLSVQWALAGSLRRQDAQVWRPWQPDIVGVRGDVCRGNRTAALDAEAIEQWTVLLKSGPGESSGTTSAVPSPFQASGD